MEGGGKEAARGGARPGLRCARRTVVQAGRFCITFHDFGQKSAERPVANEGAHCAVPFAITADLFFRMEMTALCHGHRATGPPNPNPSPNPNRRAMRPGGRSRHDPWSMDLTFSAPRILILITAPQHNHAHIHPITTFQVSQRNCITNPSLRHSQTTFLSTAPYCHDLPPWHPTKTNYIRSRHAVGPYSHTQPTTKPMPFPPPW